MRLFHRSKKIRNRLRFSPDQIDLILSKYRFKDDEIVSDYIVPNSKQIIALITKCKSINVNFITDEEKEFSLDLTPEYKIQQVIEKVAQYLQVEKYQIKLYYQSELLEDSLITLHQYYIDDGSTIIVKIKKISKKQPGSYQIFIKFITGKYFILDVLPTDKIRDLAMKLEIETGIQQRKMALICRGRIIFPLDDSDPTLEEKEIVPDSTLHLRPIIK